MSDINVVANNIGAMFTSNNLKTTTDSKTKSVEKLSSGYRINRAADDAAGLTISEKMRSQIRGLTQASANAQDGISMVQTADGALEEVHSMLQRCNELAIKAANGTLCDADRNAIDDEIQQILEEIDRCAETSEFNTIKLFPVNGKKPDETQNLDNSFGTRFHFEYDSDDRKVKVSQSSLGTEISVNANSTGYEALAYKIATEYVPNAVDQITKAFPSLNSTDLSNYTLDINISQVDGSGKVLAYVGGWFSEFPDKCTSVSLTVDMDDFTEEYVNPSSSKAELIESTIAHEMMHAVMDIVLPEGMYANNHEGDFPEWFVEGTAQLAGGGFTTNWNSEPRYYAMQLSSADDDSMDAQIESYLSKYSAPGRPYGHGFFAAAYIGYLANGGGDVTAENIAGGMDKVFDGIKNGTYSSLDQATKDLTGKSLNKIVSLISAIGDKEDVDATVEFVRRLCYATNDGAGSVIASGGLRAGGADVLGSSVSSSLLKADTDNVKIDKPTPSYITLQVGASSGQEIRLQLYSINSNALGLGEISYKNVTNDASEVRNNGSAGIYSAKESISKFKNAIDKVSSVRSYFGAVQNRLEHTIANLDNIVENTTSAESNIRDTDMALEVVKNAKESILEQAAQAMLSQVNHQKDGILTLLG